MLAAEVARRRATEKRLIESEARVRLSCEIARLTHWEWCAATNDVTWSGNLADLFGIDVRPGFQEYLEQIHPDDRDVVDQAIQDTLRAPQGKLQIHYRQCRPDGETIWIETIADVQRDDEGRALRVFGTSQEITERVRLEDELLQAKKLDAVGRLAGGIAHEFNNLLMTITGYAELIRDTVEPGGTARGHAEQICVASDRAAGLTRQLLAFSRRQLVEPRVFDLNILVAELSAMLRRLIGETIELRTHLQADLLCVRADPSQLEQALLNLTINARDAMPGGGRLLIETRNVVIKQEPGQTRADIKPGPYVVLSVADTGVGVDETTRDRMLEPFFTTKETGEGVGLGLSAVYGIVDQAGGYVRVGDPDDAGMRLEIYLPGLDRAPESAPDTEGGRAPVGWETVLLVEDEPLVRALAAQILRATGYQVLEASDPEAALEIGGKHSRRIHLLVTDVVMPGIDGGKLADRLREVYPDLRVIYMTGYPGRAAPVQSAARGEPVLHKPFSPTALGRLVRQVLDAD